MTEKLKIKLGKDLENLVTDFLFEKGGDKTDLLEAFTNMTPKILAFSLNEDSRNNPVKAIESYALLIADVALDACKEFDLLRKRGMN